MNNDNSFFKVVSIDRRFSWGVACRIEVDSDYFREEKKLGLDWLGAPKLLKRHIELKAGGVLAVTLMRPGLKTGDQLPLELIEAEAGLWSKWR